MPKSKRIHKSLTSYILIQKEINTIQYQDIRMISKLPPYNRFLPFKCIFRADDTHKLARLPGALHPNQSITSKCYHRLSLIVIQSSTPHSTCFFNRGEYKREHNWLAAPSQILLL